MMRVSQAAKMLGARQVGEDRVFESVSTDSRTCPAGALFVALRGEKFDGHAYVDAVRSRGAAAAMVDETSALARAPGDIALLEVADTRVALGQLAAGWRGSFELPLIAVAGSNGKTTVKEMIAAILREAFGAARVLSTEGNFNNDIGLPLTLLRLREGHRAAVVEVGMNHPGETALLASIARPRIALVNNAQREHQEFMKSVADVAQEHAALFDALRTGGIAVVNADDEYAPLWRQTAQGRGARIRTFGLGEGAEVSATYRLDRFSSYMCVKVGNEEARFDLPLPGLHNVRNALGAIAAATAAGATLDAAARALRQFRAVRGRMQTRRGRGGAMLIDDTYNANPESVHAAIDVLASSPEPRVLVLGDMGEVGEHGAEFHAEIGARARASGVTHLLTLGELTRAASQAFASGDHVASIDTLIARAREFDREGTTMLVKGSRFMRMERVVEAIAESGGA
jgi:UDP-N-acetylmuramoyl-tripeptide--D-alanyl-D-alanine ligase